MVAQEEEQDDYEETQTQLQKQIQLTDQLLQETQDSTEKSLAELTILNKQLSLREQLVRNVSKELELNSQEITDLNLVISKLKNDIEQITENFAKTVQLTYKSFNTTNFWLSLLSARNLSEAYYRSLYFRQFSQFKRKQIELIRRTRTFLADKRERLQKSIKENKRLIVVKKEEILRLQETKTKQNKLYLAFQDEEKAYREQLATQRDELKALIERSEKEFNTSTTIGNVDYGSTFASNRGYHSWPVPTNKSIIIGKFGVTTDPFGNRVVNDGIFIRTPKGQNVRAIHAGRVTAVTEVPLSGYMIIIEHGDYRTVYAKLEQSVVNVGDFVNTQDTIGLVKTDARTGETILNFLIYKNPDKFMDPEKWIVSLN